MTWSGSRPQMGRKGLHGFLSMCAHLQQDAADALLILALPDGVERVIIRADVAAHAVRQLVLGGRPVHRPARAVSTGHVSTLPCATQWAASACGGRLRHPESRSSCEEQ